MLIIGAAFAVLVLAIAELRKTTERSTTSQQVLGTANTLERLVIDLETGSRGYIITGDERFLAPWETARTAVPQQSSKLELLAAATAQRARAQRIADAVGSYLRDYSVPLVDAVRRHRITGRGLATTAGGKRRLDLIRSEFDRFTAAESGLSVTRQDRADAAAHRAAIAVTAGLAASILLVLVYAGVIVRSIVRPVVGLAAMAGRLAGGDLAVRAPENGTGEIGALRARSTTWRALWKRAATTCTSSPRNSRRCDGSRRLWHGDGVPYRQRRSLGRPGAWFRRARDAPQWPGDLLEDRSPGRGGRPPLGRDGLRLVGAGTDADRKRDFPAREDPDRTALAAASSVVAVPRREYRQETPGGR